MFTNRGTVTGSVVVVAAFASLIGPLAAAGPATALTSQPLPDVVSSEVRLKLERDGRLGVTEVVTVPEGGTARRVVPLRFAAGEDLDRVFTVTDARVEGSGSASVTGDELVLEAGGGRTTATYVVDGTISEVGDELELRWQVAGGWNTDLDSVTVSLASPEAPRSVNCLAGPAGSSTPCTSADLADGRGVRAEEIGLGTGERVDLAVGLSAGVVPPNALVVESSGLAAAFALTPVTAVGLGVLLVLLLGGVALLWLLRGRDAAAMAAGVGPVTVLVAGEDGRVAFASPDGVLPGQVGTVVDEHVDVVDVTATVIDLAVRNYLWIAEVGSAGGVLDWRIVRRNPADAALSGYERAVYRAVLPDGADSVLLSELRARDVDLSAVRDELYGDVVAKRWFARRPDAERTLWWWAGAGTAAAGAVLTAVLALTVGHALFGLVVVAAGIALAVFARAMPARTRRGSALLEHVRGLRGYLRELDPADVPDADRELVFSRSLPYAVVLGEADRWLGTFARLRSDADGTPGLYWFGETDPADDLDRFAQRFPSFLGALDGVLAQAGHLRSLRGPTP
ncbi:DUF2207 family protein [Umezawaea beigongshangensis]|uniref:DUF2207 family protein n=1 Tax=Umezawaea beigongshangensis TaxID=2780383 RepID=UPI0027DDCBE8|nr:DUF2207 domain-containing protein [Umezawaea beigongshangensis]